MGEAYGVDMDVELYKDIPDYGGRYQVSNFGNVRSVERRCKSSYDSTRRVPGRVLLSYLGSYGYYYVGIAKEDGGKQETIAVHRLVARTFIGQSLPGKQVCHCDGSKTNNRLDNLRYDTPQGNTNDRAIHGTKLIAEDHPRAKLNNSQVGEIRVKRSLGEPTLNLALRYGVSASAIHLICRGATWIGVPGPLTKRKSLLSAEAVLAIRERRALGESIPNLAAEFDISRSLCSHICIGKAYASVGGPITREIIRSNSVLYDQRD